MNFRLIVIQAMGGFTSKARSVTLLGLALGLMDDGLTGEQGSDDCFIACNSSFGGLWVDSCGICLRVFAWTF